MALFLFAVGLLSAIALRGVLRKSIATVAVALLLLVVCIASTALSVPMIRRSAVLTSAGQPFCLAIPALHRPIDGNLDMTLLYAHGNRLTPHMMLWVKSAGGMAPYYWSYHRQQFVPGLPLGTVRNCQPRPDFLDTLTAVASGLHVALGDDFYIIPPANRPRHQEDDYLTMQFGGEDQNLLKAASIQMEPQSIRNWRDADLIDASPATPIRSGSQRKDGAFGYRIRTFDAQGKLVERFRCNLASVCHLEWVSGDFLFDVELDPTTPDQAPDLKAGFEALWRSFRQDG